MKDQPLGAALVHGAAMLMAVNALAAFNLDLHKAER